MMTRKLESVVRDRPVLWVGAGLSVAAGCPSTEALVAALRAKADDDLPAGDFTEVVDAFVEAMSPGDLSDVLQSHFQIPRAPTPTHDAIARLAAEGQFTALVTTNYDDLLERALASTGVKVVVQTLEQNAAVREQGGALRLLKLHGSHTDWMNTILSGGSYANFEARYGFLCAQLDVLLQQHPLLFVGCSLQDPRVLQWLASRPDAWTSQLKRWRALMRPSAWTAALDKAKLVLSRAPLKPITLDRHEDLPTLWLEVAKKLAPLDAHELVFDVDPGADQWRSVGPTAEFAPHFAPSPFCDDTFLRDLHRLRALMRRPVFVRDPQSAAQLAEVRHVARRVGSRLTETLLSADARAAVCKRFAEVDRGTARLKLRIADGSRADAALALPWELLIPEDGCFAVEEAKLDLVRDAIKPGAPELDVPSTQLAVAVTIAAPDDQDALRYEDEAYRLLKALASLGQVAHFAELGEVDDLVELVRRTGATAVHFSGHGLPGELVFEDEFGLSKGIRVGDLMTRLRQRVQQSGVSGTFPRLFFLASCYGASPTLTPVGAPEPDTRAIRAELEAALGEGPSTAATLHREGFACVLGYFGPIGDAVSTSAEVALYKSLAEGRTILHAVKQTRSALAREHDHEGQRYHFPLGWAQLAVYLRGTDRPLTARPQFPDAAAPAPVRLERETIEVSGLPVLEHGFIGRRALQHEVRRKFKAGQRLFVLQGLGGLGKTALASQLLCKVFARDPRDQLILRVQDASDVAALRTQAETHGYTHGLPGWQDEVKTLHESFPGPAEGFRQTVLALRRHRSALVLYADNMEALQIGPGGAAEVVPGALGSWKPGVERWWAAMESLARDGVVLASTRYLWTGLSRDALVPLDRMSGADVWRMLESFPTLAGLPSSIRETVTATVDGRPRTLEILVGLLRQADDDPTRTTRDAWTEWVAPVLAQHGARLTEDLLLAQLWRHLSQEARDHAVGVGVLQIPAPHRVIDALGNATAELFRASILTRHREFTFLGNETNRRLGWEDRWSMHASVQQFVLVKGTAAEIRRARAVAAKEYEVLVAQPGARWVDHVEAIRLYLGNGDAASAWPLACKCVVWLRYRAQFATALGMLETFSRAGLVGDSHAEHLSLLAMTRADMGCNIADMEAALHDSIAGVESPTTKAKTLSTLALLRFRNGDSHDAQRIIQDAAGSLKDNDPVRAIHLILQAQLDDRYDEAEKICLKLLDNREWIESARPRRIDIAVMRRLGSVRVILGKYREAEPVLRHALSSDENVLGLDHSEICWILSDLAIAVARQGRVQEGRALLERALAIGCAKLGESHPYVQYMKDLLPQL